MAAPAGLDDVKMPDGTTKKIGEPIQAFIHNEILAVDTSAIKIKVHSKWFLGTLEFYVTTESVSAAVSQTTKKIYYDTTDGSLYSSSGTGHTKFVTLTYSSQEYYQVMTAVTSLDLYNDDSEAENVWLLRRT